MHIENDIKLDFKDVLIRPKRSTLQSRNEVILERTFKFKHVPEYEWTGVPIISANMDTTGTFEMALAFYKFKMFVSLHKYYSIDDWDNFINSIKDESVKVDIYNYISITSGIGKQDLEKLNKILAKFPDIKFISLDVANGYTETFVNVLQNIRSTSK